jgi:ABC-2 type transport system permease protein
MSVASKYRRSFGLGLKAALEYRINFFMSVFAAISPVVIQTALWIALYKPSAAPGADAGPASGGDAQLFGFTFAQMVAYTVIAQLVSRLVRTGFEYDINEDIKGGGLDRYLVKPMNYFGFRLTAFLGDKSVQSTFMAALLAASVALLACILGFPVSVASVVAFALSLPIAFILNFLIFWCVGMAGFWLTDIGFLFEAVRIVIISASGGIFPIEIAGERVAATLRLLPFRFTIQFPTELLAGRVPTAELVPSFALAFLWIAVLIAVSRLLWKAGVRRFAAVGS